MSSPIFLFDEFEFDSDRLELSRAGVVVNANVLVLRLLDVFVRRPGELITREDFGARLWPGREVSESTLTVAVTRLRRTLGQQRGGCEFVQTVYKRGYRFLRVVATRVAPSPPLAAGDLCAQARSPFVGRDRTLERLDAAMARARGGSGGLCVLTGEPGSGKTRVAEILAAGVGVPVAWGHCADQRELEHAPPMAACAGLLRALIHGSTLVKPALRDPRFEALVPELRQLLPELGGNAEAPRYRTNGFAIELATQHRLVDALARALSLISEYTPFVVILDDLQRADAQSLALLHALLPELSHTRILVVATLSHERRAVRNPALRHLLGHGNCTRMELCPLHETEVASYVLAQLRGAPNALCRSVSDKSAGNPFLMAMLVRQLRRADLTEPSQLELPTALLALVLDRFAVDDTTRELLSVAAVIGRRFSLSLLQATTGRDARSLMALLDEAVTEELIMPVRDAHTEFEFKHELLRDALYETIEASERRTWHSRAGDVLEQRQACAQRTAIAIADHVRAACPEGDLPRMVVRCIEAANASAELRSFADSAHYLRCAQEAIALMEASSHGRCDSSSALPAADGGGERTAASGSCSPEHPAACEHVARASAAE